MNETTTFVVNYAQLWIYKAKLSCFFLKCNSNSRNKESIFLRLIRSNHENCFNMDANVRVTWWKEEKSWKLIKRSYLLSFISITLNIKKNTKKDTQNTLQNLSLTQPKLIPSFSVCFLFSCLQDQLLLRMLQIAWRKSLFLFLVFFYNLFRISFCCACYR